MACWVYSSELPTWGDSNMNIHFHDKLQKKIPKIPQNICFLELSEEFPRDSESATVNKLSVFMSVKFYRKWCHLLLKLMPQIKRKCYPYFSEKDALIISNFSMFYFSKVYVYGECSNLYRSLLTGSWLRIEFTLHDDDEFMFNKAEPMRVICFKMVY